MTQTAVPTKLKAVGGTRLSIVIGAVGALLAALPPLLVHLWPGAVGPSFRVVGLVLAVIVGSALLGGRILDSVNRSPRPTALFYLLCLIPVLNALLGLSVAVFRDTSLYYLASELARWFVIPAGVVLGARLRPELAFPLVVSAGVTYLAIDGVTFALQVGGGSDSFSRVNGGSIGALVFAASLSLGIRGQKRRLLAFLALAVSATVAALSLTRGLWVSGMIALILLLFSPGTKGAPRRSLLGVVVAVTAVVSTVLIVAQPDAVLALVSRSAQLAGTPGSDVSISDRVLESRSALQAMRDSPTSVVHGMGAGATFSHLGGEVHHIHNTVVAVFFRYGVIGLSLTLVWLLALLALIARAWMQRTLSLSLPLAAFLAGAVVASVSAYVLIGDAVVAIAAGLLLRLQPSRNVRVEMDGGGLNPG